MTRTLLRCAAAILGFWAMGAQAQTAYPDRPIRLVIPYAPGGGTDATISVLAGPMGEMQGQSIVIENRTGGAGTIGAAIVAQARPDGYTLLADPSAHVVNHVLVRNISFNYERDFAPIARLSVMPLVLIVAPTEELKFGVEPIVPAAALTNQSPVLGKTVAAAPKAATLVRVRLSQ